MENNKYIAGIDPYSNLDEGDCIIHVIVRKGNDSLFEYRKRMESPTSEIDWEKVRTEINELQNYFKAVKIDDKK